MLLCFVVSLCVVGQFLTTPQTPHVNIVSSSLTITGGTLVNAAYLTFLSGVSSITLAQSAMLVNNGILNAVSTSTLTIANTNDSTRVFVNNTQSGSFLCTSINPCSFVQNGARPIFLTSSPYPAHLSFSVNPVLNVEGLVGGIISGASSIVLAPSAGTKLTFLNSTFDCSFFLFVVFFVVVVFFCRFLFALFALLRCVVVGRARVCVCFRVCWGFWCV